MVLVLCATNAVGIKHIKFFGYELRCCNNLADHIIAVADVAIDAEILCVQYRNAKNAAGNSTDSETVRQRQNAYADGNDEPV